MAIPSTHTVVVLTGPGKVEALQLPTPTPEPDEVLIKVAYGSVTPFDISQVDGGYWVHGYPLALGLSISGEVVQIGSAIQDLKVGDRVAAYTRMPPLTKATREYIALPYTVCAKIPDSLPLDQASTIADNFVVAFWSIFNQLKIPIPETFPVTTPPANADVPILIYGAGASTSQYAVELLKLVGYTNVVATASPRHHAYVKSLGAKVVVDYNSPTVAEDIISGFGGNRKAKIVFDPIASNDTLKIVGQVVADDGVVGVLLPIKKEGMFSHESFTETIPEGDANPLPKSVPVVYIIAFLYQSDEYLKENLLPKILPRLLSEGLILPNKLVLMDKGSLKERVEAGLEQLRSGQVRGARVIVKFAP